MQELIYGPFLPLEQAREQGLTRYFTGKPCSKGHISERQTSDRSCIQCKLGRARAVRSLVKELVSRDENCPSNLSLLPGSRAEAIKSGCNYYFTGKSCSKGHFAYRYTGSAHALNANMKELSAKIAGGITEIIIKEMMRLKSFRPALIIIQIYLKEEPIVAATTEPILQSLRWSQKSEGVGLVVSTSCYHNKIKTA